MSKGHTASLLVRMCGPLQVEADTSQVGKVPGTTTLIGHIDITARRRGRQPLHLHVARATVETALVEVQVAPLPYEHNLVNQDQIRWLAVALKKFPTAPAFRVTTGYVILGNVGDTTALYNRHNGTILWRETGGGNQGVINENWLYGGVTDAMIQQDAQADVGGSEYGFHQLTYYGADYYDLLHPRNSVAHYPLSRYHF